MATLEIEAPLQRNFYLITVNQPCLGLSITTFPYSPAVRTAGFARNQAYLIRPDGYIGLVIPTQNPTHLTDYVQTWGLKFVPQTVNLSDAIAA